MYLCRFVYEYVHRWVGVSILQINDKYHVYRDMSPQVEYRIGITLFNQPKLYYFT